MSKKPLTWLMSIGLAFFSHYALADYGAATMTTTISAENKTATALDAASDAKITANVKQAFLKEKLFGNADVSAMTIHVETNHGVVSLTGTAENQNQIDNAIRLATQVEGVQSVDSQVKVKSKATTNQ